MEGILDPSTTVDASGKTVLDELKGKHSEPKDAAEKAFLHCDELPPTADVDVTASHIEKVARQIKGGTGGCPMECKNSMVKMLTISIQYLSRICFPGATWSFRIRTQQRGSDARGPLIYVDVCHCCGPPHPSFSES